MRKTENKTHIEGYLYEHNLDKKVTGPNTKAPGTEFINGTVSIATDEDCTNIVPVHFTYVTATTSKGNTNATYGVLNNIIEGVIGTVMKDGKDKAGKVRIDSAIGLNEFYTDRNGQEELVSAKRNEGGFIHTCDVLADDESTRDTFKCDILITNVKRIEGDEEKGTADKVIVSGMTFDFRNALLPIELSAIHPGAMNYFESLEVSQKEPVFTKVWGHQVSETVVKQIRTESAFGEAHVQEVKNTRKDWIITGAQTEPYVWDDESSMTEKEYTDALATRMTYLATVKQRQDEYKASKAQAATAAAAPASGGFKF